MSPGLPRKRILLTVLLCLLVLAFVATIAFSAFGWGRCSQTALGPGPEPRAACASLERSNELGGSAELFGMVGMGLAIGLLGGLIASRKSENAVGWWFVVTGLVFVLNGFTTAYAIRALIEAPGSLPFGMLAALAAQAMGGPVIFLGFIFLFLLFPSGHFLSARWRWVAVVAVAAFGFSTLGGVLETDLRFAPPGTNPLGSATFQRARAVPEVVAGIGMLISVLASLACLVLRFRRSRDEERQQMRLLTWSASLMAITLVAAPVFWATPALEPIWSVLWVVAVGSIPIAATAAILKYRLYDIDVLVNKTLVYGSLTAIVGAAYLGTIVVLRNVLPLGENSDLAVAASTLMVAALFRPLRTRVQSFIDHRFYRNKYNAQHTLERFAQQLRDQVDLDALGRELVGVVGTTMQPSHASLWLKPTPSIASQAGALKVSWAE